MQILIAHRGNTNGTNPLDENKPHYVMNAIYDGFDAEVDVWHTPDGLFLGHDKPQYRIDYSFLVNRHLWIHCKNNQAFVYLSQDDKLHLVIHNEGIALTTKGYLWTAPGCLLGKKSIAVMPELVNDWNISEACGVCSDYPLVYKR
jgi:hypothetical protein